MRELSSERYRRQTVLKELGEAGQRKLEQALILLDEERTEYKEGDAVEIHLLPSF